MENKYYIQVYFSDTGWCTACIVYGSLKARIVRLDEAEKFRLPTRIMTWREMQEFQS